MPHVVFVAPRFLETTNKFVAGFAALDNVTLSVISADPESAIPKALKPRIAAHYRVNDYENANELLAATRALQGHVGKVDRLAGHIEQLQVPMAEVRDALHIEGLRTEAARAFRDKDRMKEVLRAYGVPVAKSALADSPASLRAFIDAVGFPIILKPQAGLGARSTYRITSEEDLRALEEQGVIPSKRVPLQAEEFVRAREHTCETVTVRGEAVWHSGTRYFPTPLEVLETPWVQYCVLLPREDEGTEWNDFQPVNRSALKALFGKDAESAAGTALTHMEWFLRDDGTSLVSEVGVRPPGVGIMPLMSLAYETDFWADWSRLMALDEFTPKERRWASGAAFFRGQGAGNRIVSVRGVQRAVADAGDALVEMRSPKEGMPRNEGYEGEGWAHVRHPTTEGVKQALLALIKNVQVRYG